MSSMFAVDSFRLIFGPYRTPRFRYQSKIECQARGDVTIVGLSDARIPWPIGKTNGAKSLVLFKGLARAVRREASIAVQHWFGVGPSAVNKWRRALGVPHMNEGDRRLKARHFNTVWAKAARKKAWAKARDPQRCAKIAAARRGKPRPKHVIDAMVQANLGRKLSPTQRRKMSETHKRRGTRPPWLGPAWTAAEDDLVRTLPTGEVCDRTGRTARAVRMRRMRLKRVAGQKSRRM